MSKGTDTGVTACICVLYGYTLTGCGKYTHNYGYVYQNNCDKRYRRSVSVLLTVSVRAGAGTRLGALVYRSTVGCVATRAKRTESFKQNIRMGLSANIEPGLSAREAWVLARASLQTQTT